MADQGIDPLFDRFTTLVRLALDVPVALVLPTGGASPAATDGGGYAEMPLTDGEGRLCAVDHEPRQWSRREIELLTGLAAGLSDSLRLRRAVGGAEQREQVARAAFDRSRQLLRASAALANTRTAGDVLAVVRQLATGSLDPAFVGLSLVDRSGRLTLSTGDSLPQSVAERWDRPSGLSALAVRTGSPVLLPDLGAVTRLAPGVLATFEEMGWQSSASVPLPGPRGPVGALTFVWKQTNVLAEAEQSVLAALAGYVAQALQRAETLDDRRNAAGTLQKALLSPLPDHDEVGLAARYLPAHHADEVGGDWYDVIPAGEHRLALVIGDATGHSIQAAARMSQLRGMLRTLLTDRPEKPSAVLQRLERTSRMLGADGLATVVLAYLDRQPAGGWCLTWSNAGHPPPLIRLPSGKTVLLGVGDPLLGALRNARRQTQVVDLPAGATIVLYTDGLIESRHLSIDDGIARLRQVLSGAPATDPAAIADLLAGAEPGDYEDDVALLVVTLPPA